MTSLNMVSTGCWPLATSAVACTGAGGSGSRGGAALGSGRRVGRPLKWGSTCREPLLPYRRWAWVAAAVFLAAEAAALGVWHSPTLMERRPVHAETVPLQVVWAEKLLQVPETCQGAQSVGSCGPCAGACHCPALWLPAWCSDGGGGGAACLDHDPAGHDDDAFCGMTGTGELVWASLAPRLRTQI